MIIENNAPKTVREQLFYMNGCLKSFKEDDNGCVNIPLSWLIEEISIALQLAHNETFPTITYRDYRNEDLPKGMSISSTSYPLKVGVVDYPQTTAESVKI